MSRKKLSDLPVIDLITEEEEEEADDFMMILEEGLKLRRKGAFVRLQIEKNADSELVEFLNSHLKIFHKVLLQIKIKQH